MPPSETNRRNASVSFALIARTKLCSSFSRSPGTGALLSFGASLVAPSGLFGLLPAISRPEAELRSVQLGSTATHPSKSKSAISLGTCVPCAIHRSRAAEGQCQQPDVQECDQDRGEPREDLQPRGVGKLTQFLPVAGKH